MFTQNLEQVGGPSASLSQLALQEWGPGEAGRGEQSPQGQSQISWAASLLLVVEKEAFPK